MYVDFFKAVGIPLVEYVTRDRLRYLSLQEAGAGQTRLAKAHNRSPAGATFLSHSSEDNDVMPAVVAILEGEGATVYLDNQDDRLKGKDVKDIASSLRTTINSSKKFILFASPNVKNSKWVPWELGLADGYKGSRNVALFPSPNNAYERSWAEQEYLGIYDRIAWGTIEGEQKEKWLVWNYTNNSAVHLSHWLKQ